MFDSDWDTAVRRAAFQWLKEQVDRGDGELLPYALLRQGFSFRESRVPLLGPPGIFKPKVLSEAPLSIRTAPEGPYDDGLDPNGLLRYRYRGQDADHPDNRGLRFAMQRRLPLIYFYGVAKGRYLAEWPVLVVADRRDKLTFSVAVDVPHYDWESAAGRAAAVQDDADQARRQYHTAVVRQRLHQRAFRERVLDAYRRRCACCRFRHAELLDAAHIVPDAQGGEPRVHNGIALCRLHHAAFDRYFLGVRPDYVVHVRRDLLEEEDGPTLVHGLQKLHGKRIILPRRPEQQPRTDYLERRYENFRFLEKRRNPG